MCVVGTGVVGLSTALGALEKGFKVTVFYEHRDLDTTSSGAGALLRPAFFVPGPPERNDRWTAETFEYLVKLIESEEAEAAGLRWCTHTHTHSYT
jgi:glycine/D-amino acid oxidase-like deaminating enzyme